MSTEQLVEEALRVCRLSPSRDQDEVTIESGKGMMKRTATFPMHDAVRHIDAQAPDARKAAAHSLARGMQAVLVEPRRGDASEMPFAEATSSLAPSIEGPLFASGVALAGGEAPLLHDFAEGLHLVYVIELDRGFRLLSEQQARTWAVHPERIFKAALSVLFHRSGYSEAQPVKGADGIERWAVGDGSDPARALLLDFFDYSRCRAGVYFAMPHSGELLVTDPCEGGTLDTFETLVQQRYASSDEPLSPHIFEYRDGKRSRDPVR